MDFSYSEEDQAFRREFRSWLEKNAPKKNPPSVLMDGIGLAEPEQEFQRRLAWHKKLHEGGWMGIHWPKEYGGRGASLLQSIIYNEELERFNASPAYVGTGIIFLGPTLIHWGTEEQKKRFLPKILSAEEVWCQGFSEPNAGSDLGSLQTSAREEGDYLIVNGQKVWTSAAHHADWIFLLARTDPSAPKHKGISYLLVDMRSPGITVRPLVQMTGARGFNEVFFDNVKVPKHNLVGQKNQGWQVAMTTLMFERNISGTPMLLPQVRALTRVAKQIERNGRPAWEDRHVRQKLAQFAIEAEALKLTSHRHLTLQLKGQPPGPESSLLKIVHSELNLAIQILAMELLGPFSQLEYQAEHAIDDGKWSYRMLAARSLLIAGGSNQVQRNILGERVLGLPKG